MQPRRSGDLMRAAMMPAAIVLLTACGTHKPAGQDNGTVREFSAQGYASHDEGAITTTRSPWRLGAQTVEVVVSRPQRAAAARVPVVVYLPGLGESSRDGDRWRSAWAAAGYAVLAVQLLDDDANAWRSELARSGEFKALGQQQFAGPTMARRVQTLAELIDEGRRRTAAGEGPCQQLDWDRLAIAGYDLGAYTALTVAGETVRGAESVAGRVPVRAAIALSPYASLAAGAQDSRYSGIRGPVMSITSDIDGDALGLVEAARLRQAPFAQMPGPDKFLLALQGLPHAGLAGHVGSLAEDQAAEPARRSKDAEEASSRHGGRGKRGGSADGGAGGPGNIGPRDRGDGSTGATARSGPAGLSASALQLRVIAAQDVSTAFLDAYLKDDPLAREWLAASAGRWLGAVGELRHK